MKTIKKKNSFLTTIHKNFVFNALRVLLIKFPFGLFYRNEIGKNEEEEDEDDVIDDEPEIKEDKKGKI